MAEKCRDCQGAGNIVAATWSNVGVFKAGKMTPSKPETCPRCNGSGVEPAPAPASGEAHGSDSCFCGDYRSQHDGNGACRVCGNSSAPYDGCRGFRFAHHATEAEMKHWQKFCAPKREFLPPVQPAGEPPPDSVNLISHRHPTEDEIRRGLELEPLAQEILARNAQPSATGKEPIKLVAMFKDGQTRLLLLKPPLVVHPGTYMYHITDATGVDYYFNTDDGTFDGTGTGGCFNAEEAQAIMEAMKDVQSGKTGN